uniref:DegV family protein n=1 Tax=Nocardioides alcanivorans TaxID=2897352 RepID=UPI0024B19DCD|nr:DegV family protein [Nocardioides alcanivorans]
MPRGPRWCRCTRSTLRQVGPATGYAAVAAAVAITGGAYAAQDAAAAAAARAAGSASLFYVDTLEYLRRGGRVGAAAALFGGALAVKPLLRIDEGGSSRSRRWHRRSSARPARGHAVQAAGEQPSR